MLTRDSHGKNYRRVVIQKNMQGYDKDVTLWLVAQHSDVCLDPDNKVDIS